MPAKKKKYNSRFPPARIKKIMQSDEDVGKVSQVVPVVVSKALEIFVAELLKKSSAVTRARSARTLTPAHIKSTIQSHTDFEFLRDLAAQIPDVNASMDGDGDASGDGTSSLVATATQPKNHRAKLVKQQSVSSTASTGRRGRPRKEVKQESEEVASDNRIKEEEMSEDTEEEDEDNEDEEEDEEMATNSGLAKAFGQPARLSVIEEDDDYDS